MDKNITDSHEVVSYWMVKMNQEVGTLLYKNKLGVFRLAKGDASSDLSIKANGFDMEIEKMLYNFYNHICSEYKAFKEGEQYTHSAMLVENYVHFTSPIRRLVDLLNQIYMWPLLGYAQTSEMAAFVEKWTSVPKMCYINDNMKAIRRTQTSCELVHMCYNNYNMALTYMGLIFEKTAMGDEKYEYTVYIKDLKYLARILCDQSIGVFSEVECRVFLFYDKVTVRDKIVLQIIN
jgi:exoribonuclease R